MEKYITDVRTGLRYELIGDIYYLAVDDEPEAEKESIGVWEQRHLRFIKEHRHSLYLDLLMTDKLNSYLADIDRKSEEMAEREGVTKQMKAEKQMEWTARMNNIKGCTEEIVNTSLINN